MNPAIQWLAGLAMALAGWLATRKVAGTRGGSPASIAFDGMVPLLGFACLAILTARPLFAGVVVLALIGGLAFADYAKREVLREPVVFCDMSELIEVVRHPGLYLPYAGTGRILAGAMAGLGAAGLLFWLEPAAFSWSPLIGAVAAITIAALILLPSTVFLQLVAGALLGFRPSGDPAADARRLGALATLFTYGLIARSEREARHVALAPPLAPPSPEPAKGPPVVMVQSESFFDVRRLGEGLFPNLLPTYDRALANAQSGRLDTPAFGANTVRTEFEAITGIPSSRLGFDRFNPYHAFVRRPVASLAWAMKARGYRTICLHPFDRRFYARDKVMAHLGFDEFIGQEGFPRPASGYVADTVLAERITTLLGKQSQPLFIFAITMENHGPWDGGLGERLDPAPGLPPIPQAAALKRFSAQLEEADRMIGALTQALGPEGVFALYGDHLPSLPAAFEALGFRESSSDYLVWRQGGNAARRDLAAHELASAVIEALDAPAPAAP